MAQQFCERYGIPAKFTSVQDLLSQSQPDVVHITTPPQSHYSIGRECLAAGCHLYIEKPFTVTAEEAEGLLGLAQARQLKITAGHNYQFSHASNEVRSLVGSGFLGGPPVHIEAYYCYDLGDPAYARALLRDPHHWVRDLPGGLLHNIISHGIARIAEYLTADSPVVIAHGFTSQLLRSVGEHEIVDELRAIIDDGGTTAYFTFSSQMRPGLHQVRIYGPKNGVILDEQQQTVIKLNGKRQKSFLEQFRPPANLAWQYTRNVLRNGRLFLKADFHPNHGMKILIERFYRSVRHGEPLPIPYPQILLTSRIMEDIFAQLSSAKAYSAAIPDHQTTR
jgi:predicted dehydrogenase